MTELAITDNIDKSLDKVFKYIIRDIVDFYYSPINPNECPEFSNQVRNAMNVMAMNLALCFQNLDKVELGVMSSFAISNTFIVHLVCIYSCCLYLICHLDINKLIIIII